MLRKPICNMLYAMRNIWKKFHMPIMSVTTVVEDCNESFELNCIPK